MPFTSELHPRPPRNARSLDLDDSARKAAAWVWHLHESKPGITTEGRFLSSQSRRRSSGSSDRRSSRFRREAAESTRAKAGGAKSETPMWDCGSDLYDTFELAVFGSWLDRSLMEAVLPVRSEAQGGKKQVEEKTLQEQKPREVRHGVLWTKGAVQAGRQTSKEHTASPKDSNTERASWPKPRNLSFPRYTQDATVMRWPNVGKLLKAFKITVVDLQKQVNMTVGCKSSINIVEPCQRPLQPHLHAPAEDEDNQVSMAKKVRSVSHEDRHRTPPFLEGRIKTRRQSLDDGLLHRSGHRAVAGRADNAAKMQHKSPSQCHTFHRHLHHHHHHHHHHYVHRTYLASESARLSPETLSRITADNIWITSSKS